MILILHLKVLLCNRVSLKAFDTGGILSTPASDVHFRLKTADKAILKKLQETLLTINKRNKRQQFSFTKTSIEIKVSLKILSQISFSM